MSPKMNDGENDKVKEDIFIFPKDCLVLWKSIEIDVHLLKFFKF
jgi:hypothetical protein